jgi:three-Cys-motif partner protein
MTTEYEGPLPSEQLVESGGGLFVRDDGEWAEEKLFYIERYMNIFSTGMKGKWPRRVYIDLFAGPGRSRVRGTGQEFDGSPVRALRARDPFTLLYLNDADPRATASLYELVPVERRPSVTLANLDCNDAAKAAGNQFFGGPDQRRTLGLAVIDPTAFQISFDAIRQMTMGRRIDLIITFMTGYIRRFIEQPSYASRLDSFFGSQEWRQLVEARASGQRLTFGALLDFYEDRLRSIGYIHVDNHVRILNSKARPIYHLVFASKDPKGHEFFKKISRRGFRGQQRLF